MEEIGRTEREYTVAISDVLCYIQSHLDHDLTARGLAQIACFSEHHFHRIFRAVVGESVMDHVRRLRLERAAFQLKTSGRSVANIALDAGYGAQEAFTRTFQAYFGVAPRIFRRAHAAHWLPAISGVHFGPGGFTPLRRTICPEALETDLLCPAHRNCPAEFESGWEEFVNVVTGFAALVYPSRWDLAHHPEIKSWQLNGQEINALMTETIPDIDEEIDSLQNEVELAKQRLLEARKRRPKEPIRDYVFKDFNDNEVSLADLFGDKDDLILVHNMGTGCRHCTMWADGFTGLVPHLQDRAAFVVCSPDKPEVQKRFASKRNWNFRMVSAYDNSFIQDMGFWKDSGPYPGPWPGVSTFRRDPQGKIFRIAKTHFNPNDDFCAVWPLLDMLEDGSNGWEPKYSYVESES
jgi:predicted dithiol-disulfide oxidoreductase (DUF899 family)/AraC-like DNA-binding protein